MYEVVLWAILIILWPGKNISVATLIYELKTLIVLVYTSRKVMNMAKSIPFASFVMEEYIRALQEIQCAMRLAEETLQDGDGSVQQELCRLIECCKVNLPKQSSESWAFAFSDCELSIKIDHFEPKPLFF